MRKKNKKVFIVYVLFGLVYMLGILIITITKWSVDEFSVGIEEIIFTLTTPLKGNGSETINSAIKSAIPLCLKGGVLYVLIVLVDWFVLEMLKCKGKIKPIIHNLLRIAGCVGCFILLGYSLFYVDKVYNVREYYGLKKETTEFYEMYYVAPDTVDICNKDGKMKNLICIYVESMETAYTSKENGGYQEYDLIPNLSEMAKNNFSFSNTDKLGGFYGTTGSTWTLGALFATTSGVPFAFPVEGNDMNRYDKFASGIVTLGDILEKKGYVQEFLCGSDASYAGRGKYFSQHGNYKIFDLFTAREEEYIDDDYYVWWGFEDEYLFEIAKDEVLELSKGGKPFNLTMLTVDTHFPEGYMCDFNLRSIYNCFINCDKEIDMSILKNRQFSPMDMFPTILSAMGFDIEGDRLGLGTDMFSGKKTTISRLVKILIVVFYLYIN